MIMLSIIIPEGKKSKFTELLCKRELKTLEHEIIHAPSWREGLLLSKGEFVCFIEPDSDISENYFEINLKIFTSQPLYRKLAMVASAVEIVASEHKLYGYLLSLEGSLPSLMPSRIKSSQEPYSVQIAYIPGAIIRRSALDNVDLIMDDPIATSVKLSVDFWLHGTRLCLNPNTTYSPRMERVLDIPMHLSGLPETVASLIPMFRRELVG